VLQKITIARSHTTAKTQTIGAQTSADSAKITQENLGKGDQVKVIGF
jgi:hypothetical protein